jgi:hypothetical protein
VAEKERAERRGRKMQIRSFMFALFAMLVLLVGESAARAFARFGRRAREMASGSLGLRISAAGFLCAG